MALSSEHLGFISLTHYHQESKSDPRPQIVGRGRETIELVTGGRGWVLSDGEMVEVRSGSLLWHKEGDHTIGRSDSEDPYSCLALRVSCESYTGRRVPRFSLWLESREVSEFAEEAVSLFVDENYPNDVLMHYVYSRLRFQAVLNHKRKDSLSIPDALTRVRDLIDENYGASLSIGEMANACGWSQSHLHQRFRAAFGMTPIQALLERRMRAARQLLVGSGLSIKQIANRTGFTHSSAFCASFKKKTGLSPKRYREAYFFGSGLPPQ